MGVQDGDPPERVLLLGWEALGELGAQGEGEGELSAWEQLLIWVGSEPDFPFLPRGV